MLWFWAVLDDPTRRDGLVKPAGNQLEITVVNTWRNRMIGDEPLPLDYARNPDGALKALPQWLTAAAPRTSGRFTFTTLTPFRKDDPLKPAGLLGPVTVRTVEMATTGAGVAHNPGAR